MMRVLNRYDMNHRTEVQYLTEENNDLKRKVEVLEGNLRLLLEDLENIKRIAHLAPNLLDRTPNYLQ